MYNFGMKYFGLNLSWIKWLWNPAQDTKLWGGGGDVYRIIDDIEIVWLFTVVMIYSTNAQHKRTSSGRDSAMYRDSQLGILPRDYLKMFLQKLKVQ